ncbi:MAG: Type-2 restriction enzyme EcoRV [Verrucomicrobia subdivision 3 bacterium]|nr:Type-2 restriction enzyme EcoRV [Limisphaerales bacterium]MCS1417760.1 Type-2 restriction enzyme EcoRV [Limisphaerales bacterium]
MKRFILDGLNAISNGYSICGIADRRGRVYPLGSDTKVIGAVFELVSRQVVAAYAKHAGLILKEPDKQNHYPDFTLMRDRNDRAKIAIDVKTTYRRTERSAFSYTLGSYTSYINPATESKNIVFPYSDYGEHWVIGFVYRRRSDKRSGDSGVYTIDQIDDVPLPFDDAAVFMQEKRRIAGDKAGSGNTANIGSITGDLDDFVSGKGVFDSEDEFIRYWRGYQRTKIARGKAYGTIDGFRSMT